MSRVYAGKNYQNASKTDGSSESGYIAAFNKKRRMFSGDFGDSAKECSKKIWLLAVEDFENAINADEIEAFSCPKYLSENRPGDGQDEVHIGDGISEATQVDLVPDHIKSSQESISDQDPPKLANFRLRSDQDQILINLRSDEHPSVLFI